MRVIWEVDDILPGIKVRKPECNEVWMIGYDAAKHSQESQAFAIVSLTDGMICRTNQTAADIVEFLNTSGSQPILLIG